MTTQLLSTTRWDPFLLTLRWNDDSVTSLPSPFLLLQYHTQRLLQAALAFDWPAAKSAISQAAIERVCLNALDLARSTSTTELQSLRIRILVSETGRLETTTSPMAPLSSDPFSTSLFKPGDDPSLLTIVPVLIDSEPTTPSIYTTNKTTNRTVYENARSRAGLASDVKYTSDVLLYNPDGLVTETSIFNVALWKSGIAGSRWVTPHTTTGCLPGVARRWLLEKGRIEEAGADEGVTLGDVKPDDWILLFNGLQGCRLGRIQSLNVNHSP